MSLPQYQQAALITKLQSLDYEGKKFLYSWLSKELGQSCDFDVASAQAEIQEERYEHLLYGILRVRLEKWGGECPSYRKGTDTQLRKIVKEITAALSTSYDPIPHRAYVRFFEIYADIVVPLLRDGDHKDFKFSTAVATHYRHVFWEKFEEEYPGYRDNGMLNLVIETPRRPRTSS